MTSQSSQYASAAEIILRSRIALVIVGDDRDPEVTEHDSLPPLQSEPEVYYGHWARVQKEAAMASADEVFEILQRWRDRFWSLGTDSGREFVQAFNEARDPLRALGVEVQGAKLDDCEVCRMGSKGHEAPLGPMFIVTSRRDRAYTKSGFRPDECYDLFGSFEDWQCSNPKCKPEHIWHVHRSMETIAGTGNAPEFRSGGPKGGESDRAANPNANDADTRPTVTPQPTEPERMDCIEQQEDSPLSLVRGSDSTAHSPVSSSGKGSADGSVIAGSTPRPMSDNQLLDTTSTVDINLMPVEGDEGEGEGEEGDSASQGEKSGEGSDHDHKRQPSTGSVGDYLGSEQDYKRLGPPLSPSSVSNIHTDGSVSDDGGADDGGRDIESKEGKRGNKDDDLDGVNPQSAGGIRHHHSQANPSSQTSAGSPDPPELLPIHGLMKDGGQRNDDIPNWPLCPECGSKGRPNTRLGAKDIDWLPSIRPYTQLVKWRTLVGKLGRVEANNVVIIEIDVHPKDHAMRLQSEAVLNDMSNAGAFLVRINSSGHAKNPNNPMRTVSIAATGAHALKELNMLLAHRK